MLNWRIYYADGSTFSDMEGDPSAAPGRGVLCIAHADPACGRMVHHGYDYYVFVDWQWVGVKLDGLLYYLTTRLREVRGVLEGAMAAEAVFERAMLDANMDPDLPPRSARRPSEG